MSATGSCSLGGAYSSRNGDAKDDVENGREEDSPSPPSPPVLTPSSSNLWSSAEVYSSRNEPNRDSSAFWAKTETRSAFITNAKFEADVYTS